MGATDKNESNPLDAVSWSHIFTVYLYDCKQELDSSVGLSRQLPQLAGAKQVYLPACRLPAGIGVLRTFPLA